MHPILDRAARTPFVRQFVKFSLVGVGNSVIDFGGYVWLTRGLHVHYLFANAIAWFAAVCFSFTMNKFWTFRGAQAARHFLHQYGRFFIVSVGSLLISTVTLHFLVERFGWADLFAKLCTIAVVVLWNFNLNKFWTFKS